MLLLLPLRLMVAGRLALPRRLWPPRSRSTLRRVEHWQCLREERRRFRHKRGLPFLAVLPGGECLERVRQMAAPGPAALDRRDGLALAEGAQSEVIRAI